MSVYKGQCIRWCRRGLAYYSYLGEHRHRPYQDLDYFYFWPRSSSAAGTTLLQIVKDKAHPPNDHDHHRTSSTPLYTPTLTTPQNHTTQHNHVIPLFIHLIPLPTPLPALLHRPRRRLRRPLRRQLPRLALGRALLPHVLPLDIAPLPKLLLHPRPSRPRQPRHQQPKLPPRGGRRDIRLPIRRRRRPGRLLRPARGGVGRGERCLLCRGVAGGPALSPPSPPSAGFECRAPPCWAGE